MIEFKYPTGSNWLKWELHTHSNASDGKGSVSEIIDKAIQENISVLALTDHHTAKNIDAIKSYVEEKEIEIISGIEFRTEYGAKSVHMIGLFPDKTFDETGNVIILDTKALTELILNQLDLSETKIIAKGREENTALDNTKAFKKGIHKVQVPFKKAADLIHKYGGLVVVHAGSKSNSIDEEMKHKGTAVKNVKTLYESLGTVKEELFKSGYIDICEIKNENDSASFYLTTFGKPSITASDAHILSDIGKKAIWIKANPTFEGLRQILFEPSQRVSFTNIKPDEKDDYQVIAKVKFRDNNFQIKEIHINNNLTAIIGGKSTGKSILLRTIARAIDNKEVQNRISEVNLKDYQKKIDGFEVHWKDGQIDKLHDDNGTKKKIIYIPQSYLNRLVDKEETNTSIDDLIQGILEQNNYVKSKFEQLTQNEREKDKKISSKVDDLFFLLDDYKKLGQNINKEGDKKGIEGTIKKIEGEIENLKKGSGLLSDDLDSYKEKKEAEQRYKNDFLKNEKDLNTIMKLRQKKIIRNISFDQLSTETRKQVNNKYDKLQQKLNKEWEDLLATQINVINAKKISINQKIQEIQLSLKPFQERLTKQKLFSLKLKKLEEEKEKLKKINSLLEKRIKIGQDVNSTIEELLEIHSQYYTDMFDSKEYILSKYPKEDELIFDISMEYKNKDFNNTFVQQYINLKKLSRWKEVNIYPYTYENAVNLKLDLKKIIHAILKKDIVLKANFTKQEALRKLLSNWFIFNFSVVHQGDDLSQMSPGKKSFVLLKLLIELDRSKCPILLDQPEDDLDNRSIFIDLVRFLRTKKLERQIIIATHSPNVVVGSDSELIIIANQKGEKTPNIKYQFEYVSGSIEHSELPISEEKVLYKQGIKEHVCEILEGGEKAFKNRQNKYNIT